MGQTYGNITPGKVLEKKRIVSFCEQKNQKAIKYTVEYKTLF